MAHDLQYTLGLDLGTYLGYALVNTNVVTLDLPGTVIYGEWDLSSRRFEGGGMRFVRFRDSLDRLDKHAPIRRVYLEEVRGHRGTDAAHVYGGLLAVLTAWCEMKEIPYAGIPVGTVKKHATGKGNSKKEIMIEAAERRFGKSGLTDNEADALWILSAGLEGLA